MATTTFSGPIVSKNGFIGDVDPVNPVKIPSFASVGGPDPADHENSIAIIDGVLSVSDGTNWVAIGGGEGGGGGDDG